MGTVGNVHSFVKAQRPEGAAAPSPGQRPGYQWAIILNALQGQKQGPPQSPCLGGGFTPWKGKSHQPRAERSGTLGYQAPHTQKNRRPTGAKARLSVRLLILTPTCSPAFAPVGRFSIIHFVTQGAIPLRSILPWAESRLPLQGAPWRNHGYGIMSPLRGFTITPQQERAA